MKNRLLQIQQIIFTIIFVAAMIHFIPYIQFIAWGFMFIGWGAFLFTDVWAGGYLQEGSFAFYWIISIPVFVFGFSSVLSATEVLVNMTYKGKIVTYTTWALSGFYLFYLMPKFHKWSRNRSDRRIKKLESLKMEIEEYTKNWVGGWDEEHSKGWCKLQNEISRLSTGWITPDAP